MSANNVKSAVPGVLPGLEDVSPVVCDPVVPEWILAAERLAEQSAEGDCLGVEYEMFLDSLGSWQGCYGGGSSISQV